MRSTIGIQRLSYSTPENFVTHGRAPLAVPSATQSRISGSLCTESFQRYASSKPTLKMPPIGRRPMTDRNSFARWPLAHGGVTPPWANGQRAKEFRSVMGRRPIGGIFSVGFEEAYRWKDSVQSEPEIRLWVAEGTANGARPWVTKFSGVLYDKRWMPIVERIYTWHARHEAYLRNEAPLARVGLLYSEQTQTFHSGIGAGDRAGDHVLGMYHALVEARVSFELVHEAFLTPERLAPFKLLV